MVRRGVTGERRARVRNSLFDKVVRYAARFVLVEHAVHESNLGSAAARLGLRWAVLLREKFVVRQSETRRIARAGMSLLIQRYRVHLS